MAGPSKPYNRMISDSQAVRIMIRNEVPDEVIARIMNISVAEVERLADDEYVPLSVASNHDYQRTSR